MVTNAAAASVAHSIVTASTAAYSAPTLAPTGPTPTIQQIDEAWQEHTAPSGVKYYHNPYLKESTYNKPDALKKKDVTASTSVGTAPISSKIETDSHNKRAWKEYEDPNTGQKYYSDGVTTSWEKPEGFVSLDLSSASASLSSKPKEDTEKPPKKKKKNSIEGNKVRGSIGGTRVWRKQDAVTAFKGLMLAKGVAPTLKWNEVVKLCESDSRWTDCEDFLSVGERKQALSEYQTKRANELRKEQREEVNRAKVAFGNLLIEVAPTLTGFSARSSRFEHVRSALSKDDRFYAVKDEATRESLFLDFCDDFQKREERKKRSRKKEAQDAFIAFLQEKEEDGYLSHASTWGSFLSSLSEADKADTRFVTTVSLTDSDRQVFFADFVIELQKTEDDKRRRIRDARRRAEKEQRDSYREMLHQMAIDGKIEPFSRWRGEVEELVSKDESFGPIQAQERNAPRELFEQFIEDWYEKYQRERSFLRRLLESSMPNEGFDVPSIVTSETTFKAFKNLLTDESKHSSEKRDEAWHIINGEDPVSSARLFYKELLSRAKEVKRPPVDTAESRRSSIKDESSEDEGEIVEEGEEAEEDGKGATERPLTVKVEGEGADPADTKTIEASPKIVDK